MKRPARLGISFCLVCTRSLRKRSCECCDFGSNLFLHLKICSERGHGGLGCFTIFGVRSERVDCVRDSFGRVEGGRGDGKKDLYICWRAACSKCLLGWLHLTSVGIARILDVCFRFHFPSPVSGFLLPSLSLSSPTLSHSLSCLSLYVCMCAALSSLWPSPPRSCLRPRSGRIGLDLQISSDLVHGTRSLVHPAHGQNPALSI